MSVKICGMGTVSAVGIGCAESLEGLLAERCGIGRLSHFRSAIEVPVGEVKLSNEELSERLGFAASRRISRTALLAMVAAREAVAQARIPQGRRVGLISATTVGGMDRTENFYPDFRTDHFRGRLRDVVGHDCASATEWVAADCGIEGFRTTISTACSSAANAVAMGAQMIKRGLLDYAVVGGTDALCRFTLNGFRSLMILDEGLCRPFDADRRGLNLGEGAAYLVLTADPDAEPLAQLAGYANANDAFHQTASSAEGEGAYRAMCEAVRRAAIEPSAIDYVNLHGTGTPNNDSSEAAALNRLFGAGCVPPSSSTKSFTGHTLAASGAIEAVFSVLAIRTGVGFANLRFSTPMPEAGFSPIATTRRMKVDAVLSNSFGFGGNCTSLLFTR